MQTKAPPVIGIDILRLIAAFLVVGYHLGFRGFAEPGYTLNQMMGRPAQLPAWWSFTWFGWIGVQLFFVISGFVIAFSSEGATPKKFIESRVLRLVPGMWVCVVVCGAVAAIWGMAPGQILWLSAKTAAFVPIGPWIAGQIWTIGIELFFYASILALLWSNMFHRLEWLAFGLAVASAAYWGTILSGVVADPVIRTTQLLLLQHGTYFALGLMIWLVERKGVSIARLAGITLCIATAWFQISVTLGVEKPGYGLTTLTFVPFCVWLVLVGLMAISVFANYKIVRSLPPATSRLTRIAGIMTYSLYLLHYHIGGLTLMLAARAGINSGLALTLSFIMSLIAAYLSALFVEPLILRPVRMVSERIWAMLEGSRGKSRSTCP